MGHDGPTPLFAKVFGLAAGAGILALLPHGRITAARQRRTYTGFPLRPSPLGEGPALASGREATSAVVRYSVVNVAIFKYRDRDSITARLRGQALANET